MTNTRAQTIYPPERISLREIGLRDGLQLVRQFPSTADKQAWILRAQACGVRHFEVGSFLPVQRVPQFADVRNLIATIDTLDNTWSAALALNERGIEDALQTPVNEVVCVVSATEAHSQANMRRSRAQSLELVRHAVRLRDQYGHQAVISVGISMAFGCSIAGVVSQPDVLKLAESCLEAGADVLGVADTVGFVGPAQVGSLTAQLTRLCGTVPLNVHLHDTRGMAIANAAAALDNGARILDGSLGGLGGCPHAPGASGNIVFEDLVYLCESMGFATGIDLEALLPVRDILTQSMPDEPLYGALARAGVPKTVPWRAIDLAMS